MIKEKSCSFKNQGNIDKSTELEAISSLKLSEYMKNADFFTSSRYGDSIHNHHLRHRKPKARTDCVKKVLFS